jgi:hypothetical protein
MMNVVSCNEWTTYVTMRGFFIVRRCVYLAEFHPAEPNIAAEKVRAFTGATNYVLVCYLHETWQ